MLKKLNAKQKMYGGLLGVIIVIIIVVVVVVFAVKPANHKGQIEIKFKTLSEKQIGVDNYKLYKQALEALAKDPYDRGSLLNLGYIYRDQKDYDEAIKAFNQHLILDAYDPEILLGLARVRTDQERYKDAETYYYEIVKMFPLYETAYKELLALYQQKLLALNPKFIEAVNDGLEADTQKESTDDLKKFLQDYNLIPKE